MILTVQAAIPGDFFCLSCSRLEEEELQTNIAATETLVLPSGQEVEKGDILGHRTSWLRFGLIWFSVNGATCFLFQWGYFLSVSVGLIVSLLVGLLLFSFSGATSFLFQWGYFFSFQ